MVPDPRRPVSDGHVTVMRLTATMSRPDRPALHSSIPIGVACPLKLGRHAWVQTDMPTDPSTVADRCPEAPCREWDIVGARRTCYPADRIKEVPHVD